MTEPVTAARTPQETTGKPAKGSGAPRVIRAFFYSLAGIGSALKHEQAFREEFVLAIIMVPTAAFLRISLLAKALLISSVLLVLIVELLNSGVEWCVDLVCQGQRHPFARRAKDMGSAAVLISLINCLVIWVLVLMYEWR